MRICLLSATYPPASTEGIPRQRQVLAAALAAKGHEVHVVTCGTDARTRMDGAVSVHEIPANHSNLYSPRRMVDVCLTQSQALYEGLNRLCLPGSRAVDVVDVPLWAAQGFVPLERCTRPIVVWLQTTTAQYVAINGVRPAPDQQQLVALERRCLQRASGILADSKGILERVREDYRFPASASVGVARLGLPALPDSPRRDQERGDAVEALVVGRLEKRKGTALLFEALPELLKQQPRLRVRFVGRDNSASDGWLSRHRLTYPEYFKRRHGSSDRVVFEGYVDEERLAQCYRQADFLLAPSLYESFGLIYVEAMRAGLPVITFSAGGAAEIFSEGERHGALLVTPGDRRGLTEAVGRMVGDGPLRLALGERALSRFGEAFTAAAMADETLAFYERIVAEGASPRRGASRTTCQVMDSLDVGDAVSDIARRTAALLGEMGQPAVILSRQAHGDVQKETRPLHEALRDPGQALILHYWNHSRSTWLLHAMQGRKAIYYHNITPPDFYPPDSEGRRCAQRGYAQLQRIADGFDLIMGASRHNLAEFARHLTRPRPAIHIYPVIDPSEILQRPYDEALVADLKASECVNVLFVGRIARNKRQDRLMEVFDYYYREINRHARLWLVGDDRFDEGYRDELLRLRLSMAARDRIVFTGKVPDEALLSYYRGADVFLCASEHEGFCVPIAQAMAFNVPVMAYAAAAVPETMGPSGILIHGWDSARVAELMHLAISDSRLRDQVIGSQRGNLNRFSVGEARSRLRAALGILLDGRPDPLIESTDALHVAPGLG